MSDFKTGTIYSYERDLMMNLLAQDVQDKILQEDPCKFVDSNLVSQELFRIGDRVDALELEKGKSDEQVISLKRYYTLLEAKDYLFFKKINEKCDSEYNLNLFFYSNDPKKCPQCQDQGFVLSYARTKDENMRTYSFDVDLDLPVVQYLVLAYNVTEVPTNVFNEEVYTGFLDNSEVDEIIEND